MTFTIKVKDGTGISIVYTVEAESQAQLDAYLAQHIPVPTLESDYSTYISQSIIPELDTPDVQASFSVVRTGAVGSAGAAMGPMGLSYSRQEVKEYNFYYLTQNGEFKKARLDNV